MPDKKPGIVKLHGREYKTVALRVSEFRAKHPVEDGFGIITEIIREEDGVITMRATIIHNRCPGDTRTIAVGHARESVSGRGINSTNALENCETSAVGRALAAAGFGGTEYCSADELVNALKKQGQPNRVDPATKELQKQVDAARKGAHHPSFTEAHCRWFFARLGELGISYDDVKAYTHKNGWGYPSTWPADKRRGLLDSLADGEHSDIPRKKKGRRS